MRTKKTLKLLYYNTNTAIMHSNICCSKSRSFKNLAESRTVTVCIQILPSLVLRYEESEDHKTEMMSICISLFVGTETITRMNHDKPILKVKFDTSMNHIEI